MLAEVEAVLGTLDGVAEVAVVGLDDDVSGEALVAFVVARDGADVHPDELLTAAARSLARYKLPRRIEVVDALPHTITGKVPKWQLRVTDASS